MSTSEKPANSPNFLEVAISEGRKPYLLAQIALIDMRAIRFQRDDWRKISVSKDAIAAVAQADRDGILVPPLAAELSEAVQAAAEYGSVNGAYRSNEIGTFPTKVEARRTALDDAALLMSAVVAHGLGIRVEEING